MFFLDLWSIVFACRSGMFLIQQSVKLNPLCCSEHSILPTDPLNCLPDVKGNINSVVLQVNTGKI